MYACAQSDDEEGMITRTLLSSQRSPNINAQNTTGWTCSMLAAREGNSAAMSALLDQRPNINLRSNVKKKKI